MIIRANNLKKVYRGRAVVDGVSLNIAQGEVVGLLGPNGAGKTTTFYMIVGLVKPLEGQVFLDDVEITDWPIYKRAKASIGYLPQEPSVFRKLSVQDNLKLVLEMTYLTTKQQKQKLEELLADFHIKHIRDSHTYTLSGGERRRVEIARALATDPKFILLDEPFTGIVPVTIEELQEIVRRLKDRGIGVLITDHNVEATLAITDRSYIIVDGKIIVEGLREEVLRNELARKHYFGTSFDRNRSEWSDSLADFLNGLSYPANKALLMQQARKKSPSDTVRLFIQDLPSDITFESYKDLESHFSPAGDPEPVSEK